MIILSRDDWEADPSLPPLGDPIGPTHRTEVFIHHTAVTDTDTTPNEWESLDEVKSRMQQLQTIRPDLGLDVPYNMVAFSMSNGELVLCEGRGLHRTGAHIRGHNRSALAIAFQGDFENKAAPSSIDAQLADLSEWLKDLRENEGFVNLGNSLPARREVWGHGDVSPTACPGKTLFDKLPLIRFIDEAQMDKPTWKLVQRALQAQEPPLYGGKPIDGIPGTNTNTAVRAFERRLDMNSRGVIGPLNDPAAGIWPATRELLFATVAAALIGE